jgi:hypothetical protein
VYNNQDSKNSGNSVSGSTIVQGWCHNSSLCTSCGCTSQLDRNFCITNLDGDSYLRGCSQGWQVRPFCTLRVCKFIPFNNKAILSKPTPQYLMLGVIEQGRSMCYLESSVPAECLIPLTVSANFYSIKQRWKGCSIHIEVFMLLGQNSDMMGYTYKFRKLELDSQNRIHRIHRTIFGCGFDSVVVLLINADNITDMTNL